MDKSPYYRHTTHEGVDTYTYAEWDEDMGTHVHALITQGEFEAAGERGDTTKTEAL